MVEERRETRPRFRSGSEDLHSTAERVDGGENRAGRAFREPCVHGLQQLVA
jgi:hypothetical protein